jgi:cyclic beta-1,2-glucan synthetase
VDANNNWFFRTTAAWGRLLPAWVRHVPGVGGGAAVDEDPIRAHLFTADEMEQHGRDVAAAHEVTAGRGPDRLLPRLAENERVLVTACEALASSAERKRRVTPAGEWLLDNFYLIEDQVRTAKRHLPPGYSRELPRLAGGANQGLPRVYELALHAVAHGDGRLGRGTLTRFIAAYQAVRPLQLGELWAIPIMLRLALIENLRRVAARVTASLTEREQAGQWADLMIDAAENDPKSLIVVVADMARSEPPMTAPFVAELSRRLHGRGATLVLPLNWAEQHLAESQQTIEQLVQLEAQSQAAAQVSVSNSIGSLRLLGSMDWREFVETLSRVEETLREDPADVYARMDFATRDSYRHEVERIARRSPASEPEVAAAALRLARASAGAATGPVRSHVGWWLRDAGRLQLEREVGMQPSWPQRAAAALERQPLRWYGGGIVCLTLLLAVLPLLAAAWDSGTLLAWEPTGPQWRWVRTALTALAAAAALLAASQLAVAAVNWLMTLILRPQLLPRMDYTAGLPHASRTLVVVPTMLSSAQGVDELVDSLEVRALANRDENLAFALLTDFLDAPAETLPGDAALLEQACSRIEALNAAPGAGRFFLLHRPRRWNPREGVWMGQERKRGKLADLNALLRGGGHAAFSLIVGDTRWLQGTRCVITLDTDTQLPRDAARQLVGAMAHPLNRPRLGGGAEAPRVAGGYGILQPRVGVSLATSSRTRYGRIFAGEPGIDPYTRAVSDVYQDLFGEGSFIGKGIYDVDAFEQVLGARLP